LDKKSFATGTALVALNCGGNREMQPANLKSRFDDTIRILRGELQRNLEMVFARENRLVDPYLKALGIPRGHNNPPRSNEIWSQNGGGGWRILREFFADTEAPRYSSDFDEQSRTKFVASLFGLWLYFFDPTQGTYYYPFVGSNPVFWRSDKDCSLSPRKEYQELLIKLLSDYRLTIGEGSQGLAARSGRDVILPNTFTDARGTVALEDIFLRNLSFMSFGMRKKSERFGAGPFAYLGLMFPTPIGSDNLDCCRDLHSELRIHFVDLFCTSRIELLLAHYQDFLITRKHDRVAKEMKREVPPDERATCDRFARALLDPIDMASRIGLRDPFGFASVHIALPRLTGSLNEARWDHKNWDIGSWIDPNAFSSLLRERIELALDERTLFASSVGDLHIEIHRELLNLKNARSNLVHPKGVVSLANFRRENPSKSLTLGIVGEKPSPTEGIFEERFRTKFLSHFQGFLAGTELSFESHLGELIRWAGFESNDGPWMKFEQIVIRRKVWEAILSLLGSAITAELVGNKSDDHFSGVRHANRPIWQKLIQEIDSFLSHIKSFKQDLVNDWPNIGAAYLISSEAIGLQAYKTVRIESENERQLVLTLLTTRSTMRILSLVAQHGREMPMTTNLTECRQVRIVPSTDLSKSESTLHPICSHSGQDRGEPFNFSLMTALSDSWFWVEGEALTFEDPTTVTPRSVAAPQFSHVYWVQGPKSAYVILGPKMPKDELAVLNGLSKGDALSLDEITQMLSSHAPSAKYLITEWSTEMTSESLVAWSGVSESLERIFGQSQNWLPPASVDANFPHLLHQCAAALNNNGDLSPSFFKVQVPSSNNKFEWAWRTDLDQAASGESNPKGYSSLLDQLFGLNSNLGNSLLRPEFGLRYHLPIALKFADGKANHNALAVFSSFTPRTHDPLRDRCSPVFTSTIHRELLIGAVDYLEFLLTQQCTNKRFENLLENLAALKAHEMRKSLRDLSFGMVRQKLADIENRLIGEVPGSYSIEDLREVSADLEKAEQITQKLITINNAVEAAFLNKKEEMWQDVRFPTQFEGLWKEVLDEHTSLVHLFQKTTNRSLQICTKGCATFTTKIPLGTWRAVLSELLRNLFKWAELEEDPWFYVGINSDETTWTLRVENCRAANFDAPTFLQSRWNLLTRHEADFASTIDEFTSKRGGGIVKRQISANYPDAEGMGYFQYKPDGKNWVFRLQTMI
jgi:hypothetical protein